MRLSAQDVGSSQTGSLLNGAGAISALVHQALLRAEAREVGTALGFLDEAKQIGVTLGGDVQIFDPVPALLVRLAGRERAQLLVQSDSRTSLQAFLRAWRARLAQAKTSPARWALEVDPLEL